MQGHAMRAAWAAPCRGGAAENRTADPVIDFRHRRNRLAGLRTTRGGVGTTSRRKLGGSCFASPEEMMVRPPSPSPEDLCGTGEAGPWAAPDSLARHTVHRPWDEEDEPVAQGP
ncbi:hypothetical protein Taro_010757 [Colocasia esculenta]|uniref:Uncharacterized protein n=1 Tax=Colocasia esculenta TaxID=4460 RepID=A0A843U4I6_COLES|nr:hypothetical protein [Colocasia esculenta]